MRDRGVSQNGKLDFIETCQSFRSRLDLVVESGE
jgi:hypothetical protein